MTCKTGSPRRRASAADPGGRVTCQRRKPLPHSPPSSSTANLRLCWLFSCSNSVIKRAANDTGSAASASRYLASLVYFEPAEAYVGRGGNVAFSDVAKLVAAHAAMLGDRTALLRRVIFIGKPTLRLRLDGQRVGLRGKSPRAIHHVPASPSSGGVCVFRRFILRDNWRGTPHTAC
jgi:hypothetical protein